MRIIKSSDQHIPFNEWALAAMMRVRLKKALFINVYLKGGRFSSKSWYVVIQILEILYADPSKSAVVIAMTITAHQKRGISLFDTVLANLGLSSEWKWEAKKTKPILYRYVNGYRQEIVFTSLSDLETAGFEPIVNPATGKKGHFGIMWADEMSKKADNSPDADFSYIERLKDAVQTAKNTFIRHIDETDGNTTAMITFYTLNPWGADNPLVKDYHKYMGPDDLEKLKTQGYNLGYYEDNETFEIYATTNYLINTKLNKKAKQAITTMLKEPRANTAVWGATGRNEHSKFSNELDIMERLSRGNNLPGDLDFVPINLSMDVGSSAPSVVYINGFDARYTVKMGRSIYPTRLITKGEYVSDPKIDLDPLAERYKKILIHIQQLGNRWPQIKKDKITLYVDGSAKETVELLKVYIRDLKNEYPSKYDIDDWLTVKLQNEKWKKGELREKRKEYFSELVGNYALVVDVDECPKFYSMTAKILSANSEQLYDHAWDALMYGIMPIRQMLLTGLKVKAIQQKPNLPANMD